MVVAVPLDLGVSDRIVNLEDGDRLSDHVRTLRNGNADAGIEPSDGQCRSL
jgi:hypothetical protein